LEIGNQGFELSDARRLLLGEQLQRGDQFGQLLV
jgi:hypothetical protein